MPRHKRVLLWTALSLLLIMTCANERAITGGPEDKEPPVVLYSYPENESVEVDRTTDILIKFNEQMKKSTFSPSIQIWPRPAGGYTVKSSWTWLKVHFNEELDSNETYLLTLDKGVQDLRGNGLSSTYVMAFSTGSDLNAGRLMGTIYGPADIRKNGDLLLYRQFDTDLPILRQQDADYVFQPDDAGHFELPYLAERSYMLFYHWDRNHNKQIDGDDYFGRPEAASVLARSDSSIENHKIWPQVVPLKSMKLLGLNQLDNHFLQVRVNRLVTKSGLGDVTLFVDGVSAPILGATPTAEDDFAMNLDLALPLPDSAKIWVRNFQDTSGYKLNSDTLILKTQSVFDSLALGEIGVNWWNSDEFSYFDVHPRIRLESNLPVLFRSDSAFSLVDQAVDSVQIPGSLKKLSSMEWVFVADSSLVDGKKYKWQIRTDQLDAPLNKFTPDSLMEGTLRTVNLDSLGSLRVMHMGVETLYCQLEGKGVDRSFILLPGEARVINNLRSHSYTLTAFVDQDGDGRYLSGGMGPAGKSEPFWFYPDEIKIRARWETDLGIWMLSE